ncbi:MAG: hypothetical protein R6V06_02405 [Kiritimatiellia bacterium]
MAEDEKGGVPPKATPGAPRPINVKMKPVAPKTETQEVADAEAKKRSQAISRESVSSISSGPTARVPIPSLDDIDGENVKKKASAPATVKLRPVKTVGAGENGKTAASKPPITPVGKKTPVKPAGINTSTKPVKDSHKPGSNPLPPGPKPPSDAQVHAAKSKTSRISLDSAIGVAPEGPMSSGKSSGAPKTIKLKRPAKLAGTGKMPSPATSPISADDSKKGTAPIGKTSRIPHEVVGGKGESETGAKKKPLSIKKKNVSGTGDDAGGESADFEGLTPVSDLNLTPVKEESAVLTTIAGIAALAAVIVGILLVICLASHAVGPNAGPNSLASVKAGFGKMWPGVVN